MFVNARSGVVDDVVSEAPFDFEAKFQAEYAHIANVIARVVQDRARAEELAVDVFLKFWRNPQAHDASAEGWLYRTAVRTGLDELRRRTRRARYERLFGSARHPPTPEDVRSANEEQRRVRAILASIEPREAELLLLRSHGLSYDELASALALKPASIGTLLSRAQDAFRKGYIRKYGKE
jgi:RNA polymerase sigma-70 factor, ECF subfamily